MSSTAVSTASDRAVTTFFKNVKALNGASGQVRKVSRVVLRRNKRRATSYLKELQRLEQTIHQLKAEIVDDAEVDQSTGVVNEHASASSVQEAPESVRAKLDQLVRGRELLPSAEFLTELGLSRQALSKAVGANRMFYVDFRGERYFPAFYANPMYRRAQLEAVTKVLGDLPGGAKLQFFSNRRGSLGGATPLEALAAGKLQKVKDVAAAFADQR
jgi:hypothetical protein